MSSIVSAFANLFKGIGTTYSFKDLSGAITSPLAGGFNFTGQIGSGKITIEMLTDHGGMDTAADGTVMPFFVAGRSARVTIEVQQTSTLHKWLLFWHNLHVTASSAGEISQWAGTAMLLRNVLDGTSHTLQGVTPTKVPPKSYAASPTPVVWELLCANCNNL